MNTNKSETDIGEISNETTLSPQVAHDLVSEQLQTATRKTEPSGAFLLFLWGMAWLIGYVIMYWGAELDGSIAGLNLILFACCLGLAAIINIIHVALRVRGQRGPASIAGAMWGAAWPFAFIGLEIFVSGLTRAGASKLVLGYVRITLPTMIVALLFIAGAAMWRQKHIYVLGIIILFLSTVSSHFRFPHALLFMAIAGGGALLIGSALAYYLESRVPDDR